mmetsp:Transcript_33175/g.80584  ORF Transcript_33175/g.80584 Transcript_33175/m.80584 type:complete len:221 (-) Transcript_33175:1391-2053(-)
MHHEHGPQGDDEGGDARVRAGRVHPVRPGHQADGGDAQAPEGGEVQGHKGGRPADPGALRRREAEGAQGHADRQQPRRPRLPGFGRRRDEQGRRVRVLRRPLPLRPAAARHEADHREGAGDGGAGEDDHRRPHRDRRRDGPPPRHGHDHPLRRGDEGRDAVTRVEGGGEAPQPRRVDAGDLAVQQAGPPVPGDGPGRPGGHHHLGRRICGGPPRRQVQDR